MSIAETPGPSWPVEAAPTRRAVLSVGGGLGVAAVLAACAGEAPAVPVNSRTPFVRITTTGAIFSPTVELAAGSTATVSWALEGGATVTGLNPRIAFGSVGTRHIRMTAEAGGADALGEVVTFNLGFNHEDDAGTYNMGAGRDARLHGVLRIGVHRVLRR